MILSLSFTSSCSSLRTQLTVRQVSVMHFRKRTDNGATLFSAIKSNALDLFYVLLFCEGYYKLYRGRENHMLSVPFNEILILLNRQFTQSLFFLLGCDRSQQTLPGYKSMFSTTKVQFHQIEVSLQISETIVMLLYFTFINLSNHENSSLQFREWNWNFKHCLGLPITDPWVFRSLLCSILFHQQALAFIKLHLFSTNPAERGSFKCDLHLRTSSYFFFFFLKKWSVS